MSVLTPGQAQIVSVASRGHNLLITGQAGTGKSTVVEEIISNLNAVGLSAKKRCLNSIFPFSLYLSRDWSYITKGRQNAPVGSSGKSKIFNGKF